MNRVVYWFCATVIFHCYVSAYKPCKISNNENGSCTPISLCQSLVHLVNADTITPESHQYLESLVCSYWGLEPYVCCVDQNSNTSPLSTTTEIIKEETVTQILDSCQIPNGLEGNCVFLEDCQVYNDLMKNISISNQVTSYISRSQCGKQDETSKVCCPVRYEDISEIILSSTTEMATENILEVEQKQITCMTPDFTKGICIFLSECEQFKDITMSSLLYDEDIILISKSRCGLEEGKTKVCCPVNNRNILPTTFSTINAIISNEEVTYEPIQELKSCTTSNGLQGNCVDINICQSNDYSAINDTFCGRQSGLNKVCCRLETTVETSTILIENKNNMDIDLISNLSVLPERGMCGKQNDSPRFANKQRTYLDEYPWMALLMYEKDNQFHCGGVLISTKYVLTAAHCITGVEFDMPYGNINIVRLGEYNFETKQDCIILPRRQMECNVATQDIPVDETVVHPGWLQRSNIFQNDIALIRLARETTIYNNVRPICLKDDTNFLEQDTNLIIAGWGIPGKSRTNITPFMLQTKVPIVNKNYCSEVYKEITLNEGQFCAERFNDTKDICPGDSGGPVMVYSTEDSAYICIGIISVGSNRCGLTGNPMIYSSIPYYIPWIVSNIKD